MTLSLDQIEEMGHGRDASSVSRLLPLLSDPNPHVRTAAATALGRIRSPHALPVLLDLLSDNVPEVRQSAAWALGELGHGGAVNPLMTLLHDPSSTVRSAVVWALGQVGETRVLPELLAVSRFDPDRRVQQAAAQIIDVMATGTSIAARSKPPSGAHTKHLRVQQLALVSIIVASLLGLIATAIYFWDQPLGPKLVGGGPSSASQPIIVPPSDPVGVPQCGGPRTMVLLLVGTDRAEEGFETGSADVIRVARIDFVRLQALVLAVPRDLWVTIPGLDAYGISENRIKTAYPYGNHYEVPGRGASLLAQTLSTNFGLSVKHYVVIDFETFAQGIDKIGGVDVLLTESIGLPGHADYYPEGVHHFDGRAALDFARVRPENSTDVARIDRQTQVLMAARDKVLSPEGISQLPSLVDQLQATARTDLSPSQFSALLCAAQSMDQSDLILRTINENYYVSVTDSFGFERLLPDSTAIQQLSRVFMAGDVVEFTSQLDN